MSCTYRPLEVFGPEHEFALVNRDLQVLPISDKIIKSHCGKIVNFIEMPRFTFGKELQLHVMEIKANLPFSGPIEFEDTMQHAVSTLARIVEKQGAVLLGTGMHPLLIPQNAEIWSHYHKKIYQAYGKIFNLNQHGWLNIQSFHLNLPYQKEIDAVKIHNQFANLSCYLPAITASSPIYEGKIGPSMDNRLEFYKANQQEVPSITGDVIPEYVSSIKQYKRDVIERYSKDLASAGADKILHSREWVNSRGIIIRFDRCAIEVRVIDEQECIKMDVAYACFVRAALRGLISQDSKLAPHQVLVEDFNDIILNGRSAATSNSIGKNAKNVCQHYLKLAQEYADSEEKKYLPLVKRRIEEGSLSELIRKRVERRAEKTNLREAILDIYSTLIKCLNNNEPF
jgi:gamma-glutamyl:cysteine ligase YbdK (ATP-grasp superfamily)